MTYDDQIDAAIADHDIDRLIKFAYGDTCRCTTIKSVRLQDVRGSLALQSCSAFTVRKPDRASCLALNALLSLDSKYFGDIM
jgi:hypothetical protein